MVGYLTLTEKVTIANPYFLFNMTHLLTDQVVNVILADISAFKERYNQFAVVEGTTFTLLNGEYEYKVYAHYFTSGVMGRAVTSAAALLSKKHMSALVIATANS